MFSVNALRPKVLVELGTFRGASYCAFCQAVKTTKIETKCFAVDTWQGDEHAGSLEPNALSKLRAHHDPLYKDFSRLINQLLMKPFIVLQKNQLIYFISMDIIPMRQ